jgi:hypothetical protein
MIKGQRWLLVTPCQNVDLPKQEPWPILCCCGASIADRKEMDAHTCRYMPGVAREERQPRIGDGRLR